MRILTSGVLSFCALFTALVVSPTPAHAGVFSTLMSVVLPDSAAASATNAAVLNSQKSNSQTMGLLSAPLTMNPKQKSKTDAVLVYDNALVSEVGPSGTSADIEEKDGSTEISTYIVKSGDTLGSVAKMFNVSVNTVMWANNLQKNSTLSVGSTLVILPISGVKHTVVKGDTIQSIAKKYGGDSSDIISYNGLTSGQALIPGDVIIIPDGEIAVAVPVTPVKKKVGVSEPLLDSYPNGPSNVGYFIKPVNLPKTQGLHGHNAIDFGGPVGTPVRAAADGTILIVKMGGWNGGYGNYVVISHPNGEQTLYAHLSAERVSVGQHVSQGDVIGNVGSTGESTGPHLHFEVRGGKNPFGP